MLKSLAVVLMLAAAPALAQTGESLRQFNAQTTTPLAEILAAFKARLPDAVLLQQTPRNAVLTYTGEQLPPQMAGFVTTAFEGIEPASLTGGRGVIMTLSLSTIPTGTDMSLMLLARFATPQRAGGVPGGTVILDGLSGDCAGQLITLYPMTPSETARAWLNALEDKGFDFSANDADETSFFIGHAPHCSVALYLRPEEGSTLATIRYLEE